MENNLKISKGKQKFGITKKSVQGSMRRIFYRIELHRVTYKDQNIFSRHFIRIFTTYRFGFTTKPELKKLPNKKKSSSRGWSFTRNSP